MSKFHKLYAIASKATNKAFSVSRKESEGSVGVRFEGFPSSLTSEAVEALAQERGGRVQVTAPVGNGAVGKASGVLGGNAAAELVRELTTDDTDSPTNRTVKMPVRNGKPETLTA